MMVATRLHIFEISTGLHQRFVQYMPEQCKTEPATTIDIAKDRDRIDNYVVLQGMRQGMVNMGLESQGLGTMRSKGRGS